jgi:hypothetical protein
MPAPPARTEISNTYPNPSNAVARTGFGKLWDYVTALLGATGNASDARTALDVPGKSATETIGGTWVFTNSVGLGVGSSFQGANTGNTRVARFYQNSTSGSTSPSVVDRFVVGGSQQAALALYDDRLEFTCASAGSYAKVVGSSAGLRFDNISGSGGSNNIAFGWTGSALGVRIDSTNVGTLTPSDIRLKSDVQDIGYGLADVLKLRPVSFHYDQRKCPVGFAPGKRLGLVAQEAEAVVPEVVSEWTMDEADKAGTTYKQIDERMLVPVLVRAIQQQQELIVALNARLAAAGIA